MDGPNKLIVYIFLRHFRNFLRFSTIKKLSVNLTDVLILLQVQVSAATLIAADSAARAEELAALAGTWDGEKRVISK